MIISFALDAPIQCKRQMVENHNILMFLRQDPLIWNCLNTSCVRKMQGNFKATSIHEDSFQQNFYFCKTRPKSKKVRNDNVTGFEFS